MLVVPPSQDFKSHGDHGHSKVEPFSRHALHHSRDSQEHRNDRGESEVVAHDSGHRVLICDRDRKWSGEVRRPLDEAGLHVVQTPLQAPNANAYAERFVRSIKEECLERMIPLGERHFRRAVTEFVDHYHWERNHQGLENTLIAGSPAIDTAGRVHRRSRLGGLLNYYERAA
jgi:transposase InsO family protein